MKQTELLDISPQTLANFIAPNTANIKSVASLSRVVTEQKCQWCGIIFLGTSRSLFCQNKCRQKNKRWIKWLSTANNKAFRRKIDLLSNAECYGTASYADLRKLTQLLDLLGWRRPS